MSTAPEPLTARGPRSADIAEALGLDASACQALTIEVFPGDVIRVRSNHTTTEKGIEQVCRVFRREAAAGRVPAVETRPFIPLTRVEDLTVRAAAGTLTSVERLALGILAGGRDGEESVPALLDAAIADYGHGSYRVPVRAVADFARARAVVTAGPDYHRMTGQAATRISEEVRAAVRRWLAGQVKALLLPSGWTVQVYESVDPGVELSIPPDGG